MKENPVQILRESIRDRAPADGGFAMRKRGKYRPDANAWAIIGLAASGDDSTLVASARSRLSLDQQRNGGVILSALQPRAMWPTSLAAMAWTGASLHADARIKAIDFLLNTTGLHFEKTAASFAGHDTTIKGWPWIENTHSWIEPTALVLLTLEINGLGEHARAREARRMLMDRQLDCGGWNYGNTTVFGQKLRPMPESTGMALSALSGRVSYEDVAKSIRYLEKRGPELHTPLSLGWSLLGLGAWGAYPEDARTRVRRCLERQHLYGGYDTPQLALLLAALFGQKGFCGITSKWSR